MGQSKSTGLRMPLDVLADLDAYADKLSISRSEAIIILLSDSMGLPYERKVKRQYPKSTMFVKTDIWKSLRYTILERDGFKCQYCGRDFKNHGVVLHVDHIKPKSKFPELAFDPSNLQTLCEDCNMGKGTRH